jgi:hypothetical protein
MKRWIFSLLLIAFIPSLVGCPKLIRQKKLRKEDLVPIYVFNDSYDLKTPEIRFAVYDKNFLYWKSSHDELMQDLGNLPKRRQAYYIYTLDYFKRMQGLLSMKLSSDMDIYIGRYERLKSYLLEDTLKVGRQSSLHSRLKFLRKDIVKEFSPRSPQIKAYFNNQNTS